MAHIFWFEDDLLSMEDIYKELKKKYNIIRGATWESIKQERKQTFDLILLDLMIHKETHVKSGKGNTIENIAFEGINWRQTGIEFLSKIRKGLYNKYGFKENVPVIVVSAVADYTAHEATEKMNIVEFIDKPVSIDDLEAAIERVINPKGNT